MRPDPAVPEKDGKPRPHGFRQFIAIACWGYLVLAIALWALVRFASERWWVATLLLFGPRWLALLPLAVLGPAALLRRRSLLVVGAAVAIVLFAVMGLCVPFRTLAPNSAAGPRVCVLTCNMHRHALDFLTFRTTLEQVHPDIVVLQEWSSAYDPLFQWGDWHMHRDGELLLASRFPIEQIENLSNGRWGSAGDATAYGLRTPSGTLEVINIHLASPHGALEAVLDRESGAAAQLQANSDLRLQQSMLLTNYAHVADVPVLISGDFNTPGQSSIFHRSWSGLTDAYDRAGFGLGHTYFSRRNAVRIDHVLYDRHWVCDRCWVGPDVGSPHRPLIAELRFVK